MIYFAIKCTLSGIIIAVISEIAKRSPAFAALIASLPLLSLLGILWLWRDTGDAERIASHAEATFWYVIPSLPMFLVLPAMLRAGVGFGSAWGSAAYLQSFCISLPLGACRSLGSISSPTGKSLLIIGIFVKPRNKKYFALSEE